MQANVAAPKLSSGVAAGRTCSAREVLSTDNLEREME
jgi:hypothetical protein